MKIKLLVLLLILCLGSFLFQKTIEENDLQIGQMLMVGFRGTEMSDYIEEVIKELEMRMLRIFHEVHYFFRIFFKNNRIKTFEHKQ